MKSLRLKSWLMALVVTAALAGCSKTTRVEPKFIDEIRPVPPTHKVISYTIQRRDLRDALTRLRESPIRLVPVFQSLTSTEMLQFWPVANWKRNFDLTSFVGTGKNLNISADVSNFKLSHRIHIRVTRAFK